MSNLNAEQLGFESYGDVSRNNLYENLTPKMQEVQCKKKINSRLPTTTDTAGKKRHWLFAKDRKLATS